MKILEHTGKYRIRSNDGLYLVAPLDAWGRNPPVWESIPEAAFRFSKRHAYEQINLLAWDWEQKAILTITA